MTYPNQPQWDPYGGQQPNPYGGQPGYGQQPGYPQQQPYGAPQSGAFPQPYGPGYGQPYGPGYGPGGPGWGPAPKNDFVSAIILIIGGLLGVLQSFLPWIDSSFEGIHVNGLDIANAAGQASGGDLSSSASTLIQIAVWAVLIGGGLLVLCGVVLFVPMRNRKITGAIALVISVVMVVGAILWLTNGEANPDSTAVGYYFFLAAGVVGLIGSIVALVRK